MTTYKNKYFLLIALLPIFLTGCLGIKHLQGDQKLLYRQHIQVPKEIDRDELNNLYAQKPNRKILGRVAPLVGVYYWGAENYNPEKYIRKKEAAEKKYDQKIAKTSSQKKINNYEFKKQHKVDKFNKMAEDGNLRMQWGEPISVFDSSLVKITADHFHDYLFSKGYFTNSVTVKITPYGKKRVITKYKATPGMPYVIDTIIYKVQDTALYNLIKSEIKLSLLKIGSRYDQDVMTKERERVDFMLKDFGYYDFSRQYIEFDVDTSYRQERKIAVLFTVKDPAKRGYHKQFKIGGINFTTDVGTNIPGLARQQRIFRNVNYQYYQDNYNLKILSQRVFLQPADFYSRQLTINTQRQLANLDAFKFVNINYDTSQGKFVANIFTSPLDRYQWSNEAGVNVTQGFPGPFYSIGFKKRNIFKGMETFDLTGRFGFEGVASATSDQNVYKSTAAGVNASITFPQLIFPFKESTRYRIGAFNPKTKIQTGYAYTDRPEYRRTNISLSGTYTLENQHKTQYSATFANFNIVDTKYISESFQQELDKQDSLGNFSLVNSFKPSFVNSIILGVTWNRNYGSREKNSIFIRGQVESGGTLWNFIDPKFITDNGLQYYKYLRFTFDVRRTNVLSKNTVLAYHFNSGVAYSYGANESLPYEKFFFAGGSNSIRAWRPRRIGPGSFKPNLSTDPIGNGYFDYSIEKPSDILLEASLELRQKLFGFVDGAVFIDAGNVWSFNPLQKTDADGNIIANGNSEFKANKFYKEIGIGTGFGLRFDFTFLILRFDVGMKLYDPARDEGDRFVLNNIRFFKPYATDNGGGNYSNYKEPVIYNVGIGYPF